MVVYIRTNNHENTLDGIKVIERTRFIYEKFQRAFFRKNVDGVMVLCLCTLSDSGLYLYKDS